MTAGQALPARSRLSAKVLFIDPIRMAPSLLLPLAGVLVAGGFSPRSFGFAALGVAGSVVFAVLRWATFTYAVVGDRLELTRALVSRSVRTIPLERIRGVDVSTPALHRLLGLAVLKLDTGAGGDKQEGELNGVTVAEAERLRAVLLARRAAPSEPEPVEAAPVVRERYLIRVPRAWLRYGPLSGAYLLTPFALVAGAIGLLFQWGEEFGLTGRDAWALAEWLWERPQLLAAVLVVLVVLMPLAGGVMYAVFNWNFTLRTRDGYLVAERGLVNRRAVSLERRRIRGYELAESPPERAFGLVRMWAVVTGLGDSQTRGQLLPVAPKAEALKVAAEAVGPFDAPLRPHPPVARRRRLFRAVAPWLAVAAVALVMGWGVLAVVALALAAVGVPLGLDRYRSLGHAYDGARLSVRSGSLRRTQATVERRAVVGWTIRETWFQRRAGVVTVIAGVGAGSGGYSALDVGARQGVEFAAEVTPEWVAPFME
ncbi:PH domain-containing protein [Acrocarpospora catenulata]|uniref:PH domain-containing protein n=1 Tax=Acrocarpospora catenulata TaxID=2836182 RepID=UPI0027DF8ECD|nr:PH domain-containing protein [Acrocarpospora catenulata]